MKCCGTVGCENEATHKFCDVISCEDCLHEYWSDNEIGERESYEDFISYSCKELDAKSKEGIKIRQLVPNKRGCDKPFQKLYTKNSKYPGDYLICGYTKIGDEIQFCLECGKSKENAQ